MGLVRSHGGQARARGQRFAEQEEGLEEPVTDQALPPHDVLRLSTRSRGLQQGQADGSASLQRTTEVRWLGRRALQGAEGWNLLVAAWLASHDLSVLDASVGGDAPPWQGAAEQAVGLVVDPMQGFRFARAEPKCWL